MGGAGEREIDLMGTTRKTYPEPPFPILGFNLVPIRHPISIPPPQRRRIVNPNRVDAFDLEPRAFQFIDEPAQRARRVGSGEDVLVHEEPPDQVLVLPAFADAGDLQEEDAVVVEHVGDLL